jgi:hypothetical protein
LGRRRREGERERDREHQGGQPCEQTPSHYVPGRQAPRVPDHPPILPGPNGFS